MNVRDLDKSQQMEMKNRRVERIIDGRMKDNRDPILDRIYHKYGARFFRRCSAPADFADNVFRATMRMQNFKTAVEIGTLKGITAAVMTQYVRKVHTFDIIDYEEKYELWKFLGVEKKIQFHLIKNELEKYDILDALDFDIAYVDGDHLHCTWSDFFMTRKCGRLILHEAIGGTVANQLVDALPEDETQHFSFGPKQSSIVYWKKK